jgi:threonine aldolase
MLEAMSKADLGDDVYGEDPTVNQLQERLAQLTGKEAALFVASGTMGNLASVLAHCGRGDEVILGNRSHIAIWEQSGASTLGGVSLRTVPNQSDGTLNLEDITAAINEEDPHRANTKLIALENTWNGQPLSPAYMRMVKEIALQNGLTVHLDGARLWNASRALMADISEFTTHADSVQMCFSKGLAAPVGSIVCGNREFIGKAKRIRKALGGGMRQAGVLAAACLWALDNMVERIDQDHHLARELAEDLSKIEGIKVADNTVTNMVFFTSSRSDLTTTELARRLRESAVLVGVEGQRGIRAVVHYGQTKEEIEEAVARAKNIMAQ